MKNNHLKVSSYILLLIIFLIGINIYKDFGISVDEVGYRHQGITIAYTLAKYLNLDLIESLPVDKNFVDIITYKKQEMFSGVPFHLYTIIVEYFSGLNNKIDIFQLKHLNSFLFFFVSLFFFSQILRLNLTNPNFSIFGLLFLVLSPRIFTESFYNPNDIPFMNSMIILTFCYLKLLKKFKNKYLLFSTIATGVCFGLRPMSIYMPFLLVLFTTFKFYIGDIDKKKFIRVVFYFCFLCIFFSFLLNPHLWDNPVYTIIEQFKWATNSNVAEILYNGKFYENNQTPWHYTSVWIIITTPILYLLLSIFGFLKIIKNFLIYKKKVNFTSFCNIFVTLIFLIPFLASIFLSKSFLNGWRHLYFIYPFMIIISIIGLETIIKKFSKKIKFLFVFFIFCNLFYLSNWMIKNHPHQMVYFNIIPNGNIQGMYELDYWYLSNKAAINFILNNDDKKIIKVAAIDETRLVYTIENMLTTKQKKRIKLVGKKDADYLISTNNFKVKRKDLLKKYKVFHEIKVDSIIINSIFYNNL